MDNLITFDTNEKSGAKPEIEKNEEA